MNHSTVDAFLAYAFQTVEEQHNTYSDAHDWLSSFWAKTQHAARLPPTANRPALAELMKTPARKRTALSTLNASSAVKEQGPAPQLLFTAQSATAPRAADKENSTSARNAKQASKKTAVSQQASKIQSPRAASPKKTVRPVSPKAASAPLRSALSPRKLASPQAKAPAEKKTSPAEEVAPVAADLSIIGEGEEEKETAPVSPAKSQSNLSTAQSAANKSATSPPRTKPVSSNKADDPLSSPNSKAQIASSSPAGPAVQSFAAAGAAMRPSLAQNRTLTFVGLPKKSLGLGLGLGRSLNNPQNNWAPQGTTSESQSSTASQASATGTKRKSLEPLEGTAKIARIDPAASATKAPESAEEAARARREEMARRLEAMRARQSGRPSLGKSTGPSSSLFNKDASNLSGQSAAMSSILSPPTLARVELQKVSPAEAPRPMSPVGKATATQIPRPLSPPPRAIIPTSPRMQSFNFTQSPRLASNLPGSPRPQDQAGVRRVSVNEMVKTFEKAAASTSRLPMMSPTRSGVASPRLGLTSPRQATTAPSTSASAAAAASVTTSPVTRSMAKAQAVQTKVTMTPLGSPALATVASFQSATEQLGLGISLADETEPPVLRSVDSGIPLTSIEEEADPRVSLPAPIEQDDTGDVGARSEEDTQPFTVIVEKNQGTLANALDRDTAVSAKPSQASSTVPRINVPRHKDQQPLEEDFDSLFTLPQQQKFRPQQPTSSLHGKLSHSSASSQTSSQAGTLGKASLGGQSMKKVMDAKPKPSNGLTAAAKKVNPTALTDLQDADMGYQEQLEKERKQALKQRIDEDNKKRIEALERKRKEREEMMAATANKTKATIKPKVKTDEEQFKKRKIEEPKKAELNKSNGPLNRSIPSSHSSSNLASSQGRMGPPASTTAHKSTTSSSTHSSMVGVKYMGEPIRAVNSSQNAPRLVPTAPKPFTFASASSSSVSQQSVVVAKEPEPPIELPDIDSEYSDSDDEDGRAAKLKAMPDWAHSPQLTEALYRQARINPDEIFGDIQPLSMKEIFRTSSAKWHKRTSSACWDGVDALTEADKKRYNARMGFNAGTSASSRGSSLPPRQ